MVQFDSNLRLPAKTVVEEKISFDVRVRNLEGNLTAGITVNGSIDRGCAAFCYEFFNRIMIDLAAGADHCHSDLQQPEDRAKGPKKS
jgi:hypothetical protein